MDDSRFNPTTAYAPVPTSVRATRLRLGSWFQSRATVIRVLASITLATGIVYLTWRLVATSWSVPGWLFWPLFIGEFMGFATYFMLAFDAWDIKPTARRSPLDVPVDILIATYNEELAIVEPTVLGAKRVHGRTTIYLCDDGRRPEMKALAERHGIEYVTRNDNKGAKAGNINAVLPRLTGELVLVLDADHVPSPDFLEATTGYFTDPTLALVQTAHSFRNHNSVMHGEVGRHEQSLFFDVLLPGRNRLGSVFWCGSAAVIRTSALREVGGLSTRTSTEDFETSLTMQVAGYRTQYHNEHLIQGLAPDNLAAYIVQRARWAEGTLAAWQNGQRRPWHKNLSWRQRLSYTGSLLYHLNPIQRIFYFGTFLAVGIFGLMPIGDGGTVSVILWVLWVVLSTTATMALERGASTPFEGVRNHAISFEPFLRALPWLLKPQTMVFKVTPKNEVDLGGWDSVRLLRLPLAIAAVTAGVLLVRWVDYVIMAFGGTPFLAPIYPLALLAMSVFGTIEVVIVARLAWAVWSRKQYRRLWRFPVELSMRGDGVTGQCIDMHQEGAGIILPRAAVDGKATLNIEIDCRKTDGTLAVATGVLTISSIRDLSESGDSVRVGGSVVWNTDECREAVIEHAYIVEPYVARNRYWVRRAPRLPVLMPATVETQKATCIDISINGAAFVVDGGQWNINDELHPTIELSDGGVATGLFEVRSAVARPDGRTRLGGVMTWQDTGWINDYVTLAMVPSAEYNKFPVSTPY